jgi:cob(I)alamin adenosyltransferase
MAATEKKGLVIVHTGNGKGKTTAALGMAFRALGHGFSVLMVQFIKGSWKYGELESAKKFEKFKLVPMGRGFVPTNGSADDEDRQAASKALDYARGQMKAYNMVILDEVNYAVTFGLLEESVVLSVIDEKPLETHLILTGRNAGQRIIDRADLVTEMREIKHPYQQGIKAQRGVEF